MKLLLTLLTLSGIVFFLVTGCQKTGDDIILYPNDSLAVFNVVTAGGDCASITTEGDFFPATGFTHNENIQVEVDVLQTGAWEYSTDTVNGFWFASQGIFSSKGSQQVTLAAAGTPVSTGNYTFSLGGSPSTARISVVPDHIEEEIVDQLSYFKGTVDGVEYDFAASIQGPDDIAYGVGGNDTMGFASFMARSFLDNPPGPATIALQRDFLFHASSSTEEDFKNLFRPGGYAFRDPRNTCIPNGSQTGITISWSEPNGDTWITTDGSRNQEGSSFAIVGIEDGHNTQGKYFVKVKSRFNCRLYNQQTGAFKEVTNAVLVSYFFRS